MSEPVCTNASADTADIRIRPVQNEDRQAVWLLLNAFAVSYTPDADCFHKLYSLLLSAPHVRFLAAIREEAVVGYILAFQLPTLYANGLVCEIQELMVDPTHRRQGIGRQLVQAVILDAIAKDVREIIVPTRRAGDYYRRMGFEESASYFKLKL